MATIKSLQRIYISIILLLFVFHCNCDLESDIQSFANNHSIIDDIFRPDRKLGRGTFGIVFKGAIEMNKVEEIERIERLRNPVSPLKRMFTFANSEQSTPASTRPGTAHRRGSINKDGSTNRRGSTKRRGSINRDGSPNRIGPIHRARSYSRSRPSTPNRSRSVSPIRPGTPSRPSSPTPSADWKQVAMKIVEEYAFASYERECKIFAKLLADKNQTILWYGVPPVWYKGALLQNYRAIAMDFCPVSIQEKQQENGGKLEPINLMVVFYQLLKILKYVHGKEVVHLDLKPDNLMAHGAQLILIDYNSAEWVHYRSNTRGGNRKFATVNHMMELKTYYMEDLKSLYYLMIDLAGIELPWPGALAEFPSLRLQYDVVRDLCQQIETECVRDVLIEFHDKVMLNVTSLDDLEEDKRIFDYNAMGARILEIIEMLTGSCDPFFTWISEPEKEEAKENFILMGNVPGPSPISAGRLKRRVRKSVEENCRPQ